MRSTVAKVVGKKLPRNPYSESRRYSSTSDRTSASSSSSSRSRHREDSPKRSFKKPNPRDNNRSRREEENKRSTKSHGRKIQEIDIIFIMEHFWGNFCHYINSDALIMLRIIIFSLWPNEGLFFYLI